MILELQEIIREKRLLQMDSIMSRFWHYVDIKGSNDCWEWCGGTNIGNRGYFLLPILGVQAAYRVSYIMANGPITKDMHILHSCDNPLCVNPKHLREGTHVDNMMDMSIRRKQIFNDKGSKSKRPLDNLIKL